jgi:hypothetical protein
MQHVSRIDANQERLNAKTDTIQESMDAKMNIQIETEAWLEEMRVWWLDYQEATEAVAEQQKSVMKRPRWRLWKHGTTHVRFTETSERRIIDNVESRNSERTEVREETSVAAEMQQWHRGPRCKT